MIGKRIFQGLGLLWLTGVVMIGVGGTWLTNNMDTVAEAAVEATGINEEVARAKSERCEIARADFQRKWDRAVENNRFEQSEDMLYRAEIQMNSQCEGL